MIVIRTVRSIVLGFASVDSSLEDPNEWRARATPPGPPPVPLELAVLERMLPLTPEAAARALPCRRLLRLHARAPVPARTRRRRRRWER